ncbi:RND efflux system, outer membrane lipoprotein, NodT family [Sphingobium chlorophenolicum L-1]|uniref:RND efflux system, outer membrane lipoprotein, NodT family n=1 Tax=Sphingobium chlorophenolicum L-1 TaxID=690566 RepID=F6F1B3_SPHCR|nr:efflux transporter outer membrane subunit [Sphingobium chlorophenolicum]AEG51329.1 RND efflux system, outer membrane lipoprotein, NodT family [Sphingobium chlorophenolicum L-1]
MKRALVTLACLAALSACDMAPHYVRPAPPVPAALPGVSVDAAEMPGLPWTALIGDQRLKTVIERALAYNRDLRAALANVEAARAQYRVQRAAQLPAVTGEAGADFSRRNDSRQDNYSADIGFSAFEVDLFGRMKNLTRAALESYLETEEGARAARIALIAETASAYATLAADQELLALSRQTLASAERTLALIRSLNGAGLTGKLDVHQAETTVEQARSDIAANVTQVAQDRNALDLLVGAPVEDGLLPQSLEALAGNIAKTPAGLSSDVLLQRPDVLQAEHRLKAANADIGAARAAMFPKISLTAAIGVASSALSSLFTGGGFAWSAGPSASMPIFGGGARGDLDFSKAQRDVSLAQYEKAIQTAFQEVADALAREGTIDEQRAAQQRLVVASQRSYALADERYRAGIDTFLNSLISQRGLYGAQRSAIATELALIRNRILLYRVIGADFS